MLKKIVIALSALSLFSVFPANAQSYIDAEIAALEREAAFYRELALFQEKVNLTALAAANSARAALLEEQAARLRAQKQNAGSIPAQ